jgi:hypothetical protein
MTVPAFLLPGELDETNLNRVLEELGIERWRRETIVYAVRSAISRYLQVCDRESAKIQLEEFIAAIERLEKTFAPVGSPRYVQLIISLGATIPPGSRDRSPLKELDSLPVALAVLCHSARERLATLTAAHRPVEPKVTFVRDLAEIWTSGTGQVPTISGSAKWNDPKTNFAKFVKVVCCMLQSTADFEKGFAGLLRRAVRCQK